MEMKKLFPAITVFVLLFATAAWAADNTMTGWIVDSKCGAKAAHDGNEACTKSCLKAGATPVFVSDANKEVIPIHNADAIKGHEGHHVKVTGEVTDGALHVDKVEMVSAKSAAK
jgi:hypothetical protein